MQFGKYAFSCVFEDEAILPEYKGSTFRGVFGYALKKIVCALKRQTCDGCFLRSRCLYALVFEKSSQEIGKQLSCNSPVNNIDRQKSRIAASPNPYVIEPPVTEKTILPGDPFVSLYCSARERCSPLFHTPSNRWDKRESAGKSEADKRGSRCASSCTTSIPL